MSQTFERGETVDLNGNLVTFLASEDEWVFFRSPKGHCGTCRLSSLRKLPPPFAVAGEGSWIKFGDLSVPIAKSCDAKYAAATINAAFAARLEAEKAGAK